MSAALKASLPKSKGKEKVHPRSCARSPGSDPESLLDFQANLQALQHAQIKTALDTKQDYKQAIQDHKNTQAQLAALNQGIQGLLATIQNNSNPLSTPLPPVNLGPDQSSLASSNNSQTIVTTSQEPRASYASITTKV